MKKCPQGAAAVCSGKGFLSSLCVKPHCSAFFFLSTMKLSVPDVQLFVHEDERVSVTVGPWMRVKPRGCVSSEPANSVHTGRCLFVLVCRLNTNTAVPDSHTSTLNLSLIPDNQPHTQPRASSPPPFIRKKRFSQFLQFQSACIARLCWSMLLLPDPSSWRRHSWPAAPLFPAGMDEEPPLPARSFTQ